MLWAPPEKPRKAVKPESPPREAGSGDAPQAEQTERKPRRRVVQINDLEEAFLKLSVDDGHPVGTQGQELTVITNFFDIETLPKFIVHEYLVEFKPECVRKRNRLQMLNTLRESLLGPFAYDGMKMFVVSRLRDPSDPEAAEDAPISRKCVFRDRDYEITLRHVNVVAPNTLPYMQLLGVLFRDKLYRLKMRSINRNLYELGAEHRVQEEAIYVFPGVKSSILPRGKSSQIMLCIDKLHKVINSSTLDEYMYSFERWDQHDKDEVRRFLTGLSVVTRYNMNSYRIDDVDFDKSIDSTFEVNGRQITYVDYYKEHYNETLRCHDLPLLAVRSRRADGSRTAVYLVPELCHLSGVNTGMGGNLNIMRSLAKHCGPVNRMNYIKSVLRRIQERVSAEQQETGLHWGLNIHCRPKEIKARCLPQLQPWMEGGHTQRNWPQVCNTSMLRSVPLENWLVIHTRNMDVNALLNGIWDTMGRLGMEPRDPLIQSVESDAVRAVHDCLQRLKSQNKLDDKQLVLFVQQDRSLDRNYKEMKKVLSQHFGLVSQFVRGRNCRAKPAIHQKIALQMGCKIGCEPWTMNVQFKRPTMIFGVDCYHARGAQSVAACVATLNRLGSKFYSRCCVQQEGQELVSAVGGFVADAFHQFRRLNKRYPEQLIIYRDGVGDGQLGYIRDHEISQISQIAKSLNEKCCITFIVVKKHGSARFFVRQGGPGPDSIANPPAGMIVDHTVTNANWNDFYLIPQKVTQGTATPSHFNVLVDEANLSVDFIQDTTYKLCHMYYNWTGPIRVPAVCQYAHKLAFLVGNCMSGEPSTESMYNKLYYL